MFCVIVCKMHTCISPSLLDHQLKSIDCWHQKSINHQQILWQLQDTSPPFVMVFATFSIPQITSSGLVYYHSGCHHCYHKWIHWWRTTMTIAGMINKAGKMQFSCWSIHLMGESTFAMHFMCPLTLVELSTLFAALYYYNDREDKYIWAQRRESW